MLGLGGSGQRASRPCPEFGCTDRLTEHSVQGRRGSLGRRLQGAPRVDARGHSCTENVDDLRNALLHLPPDRRRPTRSGNPSACPCRGTARVVAPNPAPPLTGASEQVGWVGLTGRLKQAGGMRPTGSIGLTEWVKR